MRESTKRIYEYDRALKTLPLAGMDEVGRGPLAGPVPTACCILSEDCCIDGVFDSKKVSPCLRERLYAELTTAALAYTVAVVEAEVIDEINIVNALERAMRECVTGLKIVPKLLLVDAVKLDVNVPTLSIIKGDATSYHIAAASIIAKVTRDRMMDEYDRVYPGYGFSKNKGYGTAEHIEALKRLGPCPIHRRSFIGHFI